MTAEEREQIFAKEILTIADFEKLFDCGTTTASNKMKAVKMKFDRLDISGCCHVQDYLDAFELDGLRYLSVKKMHEVLETAHQLIQVSHQLRR